MHRAILNPLDKASQTRQKFVIRNYARKGRRSPPTFTKKKWSLATRVGHHNRSIRLMAIRWHLGLFPFFSNNPPSENHTLLMKSIRCGIVPMPSSQRMKRTVTISKQWRNAVLTYLNHSEIQVVCHHIGFHSNDLKRTRSLLSTGVKIGRQTYHCTKEKE